MPGASVQAIEDPQGPSRWGLGQPSRSRLGTVRGSGVSGLQAPGARGFLPSSRGLPGRAGGRGAGHPRTGGAGSFGARVSCAVIARPGAPAHVGCLARDLGRVPGKAADPAGRTLPLGRWLLPRRPPGVPRPPRAAHRGLAAGTGRGWGQPAGGGRRGAAGFQALDRRRSCARDGGDGVAQGGDTRDLRSGPAPACDPRGRAEPRGASACAAGRATGVAADRAFPGGQPGPSRPACQLPPPRSGRAALCW